MELITVLWTHTVLLPVPVTASLPPQCRRYLPRHLPHLLGLHVVGMEEGGTLAHLWTDGEEGECWREKRGRTLPGGTS